MGWFNPRDIIITFGSLVVIIAVIFFGAELMEAAHHKTPSNGPYLPECAQGMGATDPRVCK